MIQNLAVANRYIHSIPGLSTRTFVSERRHLATHKKNIYPLFLVAVVTPLFNQDSMFTAVQWPQNWPYNNISLRIKQQNFSFKKTPFLALWLLAVCTNSDSRALPPAIWKDERTCNRKAKEPGSYNSSSLSFFLSFLSSQPTVPWAAQQQLIWVVLPSRTFKSCFRLDAYKCELNVNLWCVKCGRKVKIGPFLITIICSIYWPHSGTPPCSDMPLFDANADVTNVSINSLPLTKQPYGLQTSGLLQVNTSPECNKC